MPSWARLAIFAALPACTLLTGSLDDYAGVTTAADAGTDVSTDVAFTPTGDASAEAASTSTYRDMVMADRPIAYFRMGEKPPASVLIDVVAGRSGELTGGVITGQQGAMANDPDTSMMFDGFTGGVTLPGQPFAFAGRAPFSLEAWINPSRIDQDYRRIVSNEAANANGRQGWLLWVVGPPQNESGIGIERYENDDEDSLMSTNLPPLNQWTHVVATYDGTTLVMYVDGVIVGSKVSTKSIVGQATVHIGTGNAVGFAGGLDEIALYDRALEGGRVIAHFAAGRP